MFTSREKEYLKGLVFSALETLQDNNFKNSSNPNNLKDSFEEYVSDYFHHYPLTRFPDTADPLDNE